MSFHLSRTGPMLCGALSMACLCACATVARVTNLSSATCAAQMRQGLGEILVEQGESAQAGEALAQDATAGLGQGTRGPRPFLIASPSGSDYVFFVDKKTDGCLLRLYGRRHGFVSYTNNLTWIATRRLPGCECSE